SFALPTSISVFLLPASQSSLTSTGEVCTAAAFQTCPLSDGNEIPTKGMTKRRIRTHSLLAGNLKQLQQYSTVQYSTVHMHTINHRQDTSHSVRVCGLAVLVC
ncbi:unnamed protein product, partial [Ectocarpus fasciculatus]